MIISMLLIQTIGLTRKDKAMNLFLIDLEGMKSGDFERKIICVDPKAKTLDAVGNTCFLKTNLETSGLMVIKGVHSVRRIHMDSMKNWIEKED